MGAKQPLGDLLAGCVFGIEIVIAGADEELRLLPDAIEIFAHDNALRPAIHGGGEIEMVTGDNHNVEIVSDAHDQVEQRQRIVKVGDEEEAYFAQDVP